MAVHISTHVLVICVGEPDDDLIFQEGISPFLREIWCPLPRHLYHKCLKACMTFAQNAFTIYKINICFIETLVIIFSIFIFFSDPNFVYFVSSIAAKKHILNDNLIRGGILATRSIHIAESSLYFCQIITLRNIYFLSYALLHANSFTLHNSTLNIL